MNARDRILVSVLHPVRHAAEGILDQMTAAAHDRSPDPEEALRALEVLQTEVARAATLVQHLVDEQRP
ncbi:hypothetical protein [Nonomuraea lactucae]|uniref:hypothetical protein n=1 Tax=Nonomuraea lactucae TaxID=2249762 RepID=UPI0013B390D0|nr:hypothetical protein [Nonomuraea lactucae]